MSSYPFGSGTDLLPYFQAFGVTFQSGSETLQGILDTEYAESFTGGTPSQHRIAYILIKTEDMNKVSLNKSIQYVVPDYPTGDALLRLGEPGNYDYVVRNIQTQYGGMVSLRCDVMDKRPVL